MATTLETLVRAHQIRMTNPMIVKPGGEGLASLPKGDIAPLYHEITPGNFIRKFMVGVDNPDSPDAANLWIA